MQSLIIDGCELLKFCPHVQFNWLALFAQLQPDWLMDALRCWKLNISRLLTKGHDTQPTVNFGDGRLHPILGLWDECRPLMHWIHVNALFALMKLLIERLLEGSQVCYRKISNEPRLWCFVCWAYVFEKDNDVIGRFTVQHDSLWLLGFDCVWLCSICLHFFFPSGSSRLVLWNGTMRMSVPVSSALAVPR